MITFYTCLTGGYSFIPDITDQKIEGIEYILFHDSHREATPGKGWKYITIPKQDNPQKTQRKIKMLSHMFFPKSEYTIYLDPSYYLHKTFYERCLEIIKTKPQFLTTYDKTTNRTIVEEAIYAFDRGTLTFDDLKKVKENIKDYFYSTNNSWLIRQNNKKVNKINEDWWALYDKCYIKWGRDQLLLPSVCDEDFISWYDLDKELHSRAYIFRHTSPAHNNPVDKTIDHKQIINMFEGIRNSENVFLRRI